MAKSPTRNPIKFGTDGWRGAIADVYTYRNVRVVAQATANYLKDKGQDRDGLVIGYDMRFASENFAASVAEVLAALDTQFPGIRFRVIDEQGRLRQHMKIFVNQDAVRDLATSLTEADEVTIMQALSGG